MNWIKKSLINAKLCFYFVLEEKKKGAEKKIILNFSYWSELVSENFLKYSERFFFVIHLRVNLLVTASCKKKLLYQNINKIDKNMLWQFKQKKRFYIYFRFRAEKVAQRWEHSSSANVARVQIPATTPYVGGVRCWFSPLLRGVYLLRLRFSHLLNRFTARKFDRVL